MRTANMLSSHKKEMSITLIMCALPINFPSTNCKKKKTMPANHDTVTWSSFRNIVKEVFRVFILIFYTLSLLVSFSTHKAQKTLLTVQKTENKIEVHNYLSFLHVECVLILFASLLNAIILQRFPFLHTEYLRVYTHIYVLYKTAFIQLPLQFASHSSMSNKLHQFCAFPVEPLENIIYDCKFYSFHRTHTCIKIHTHILTHLQEFIVAYTKHYFRCAKKKWRILCANKRAQIYSKVSNGFHAFPMKIPRLVKGNKNIFLFVYAAQFICLRCLFKSQFNVEPYRTYTTYQRCYAISILFIISVGDIITIVISLKEKIK